MTETEDSLFGETGENKVFGQAVERERERTALASKIFICIARYLFSSPLFVI